MSGRGLESSRPLYRITICLLLIFILVVHVSALAVPDSDPTCTGSDCGNVDVSPGQFAQKLGVDFPGFSSIKLSYPNGSILTNSTGDLLFTIQLTPPNSNRTLDGITNATFYSSIDIYISPDFTNLAIEKVWSSYTNDYDPNSLSLSKVSSTDQIAPGWWRVTVKNLVVTANLTLLNTDGMLTSRRVFAANKTQFVRIFQVTSPTIAGRYFFKTFINGTSTGSENFPTIVVKASRDPAYISGTLRDTGNIDPALSGKPISLPGGYGARVLATGIDYLGRAVAAQAFINSTAQGQYTLFGVAPGTYNITAYAAGFVPTTRSITVSVLAAQSLEGVDIYLPHSVNITGVVLSVSSDGTELPWGPVYGFGRPSNRSVVVKVLDLTGAVVASTPAPYRPVLFTDSEAKTFDFSIQREAGFDGRIPQNFANYTSGVPSGDYRLQAYVASYAQFDDVFVHVSNETVLTRSEIRLIRTGMFLITVHFRDLDSSIADAATPLNVTLTVQVYDQRGTARGSNVTSVSAGSTNATVEIIGFSESRQLGISGLFQQSSGLLPGTYSIIARFTSSPSFAGFANVGIRDLYYQTENFEGTVGLYPAVTRLSFSIFRGGGMILTVLSADREEPPVARLWKFSGAPVNFKIVDSVGNVYSANATQPIGSTSLQFFYAGLLTDSYAVVAETFGYSQRGILHVNVRMGGNSDAIVWMLQNPVIDLTLAFKTEGLFFPIDSTEPYAQPLNHLDSTPVRIEVYDANGNFEGANVSYIPNKSNGAPTGTARFTLAGFNRYFGDPKSTWSGFYDTTDGSRQDERGLDPGNYIVLVWVEGYYQSEPIQLTLPARADVSCIVSMERASRVSGFIAGSNYNDEARPLSWVVVDVEPGNYTTTSTDGYYQLWVPSGSYGIGFSLAGYSTYTMTIEVPAGSDLRVDVWLPDYQELSELVIISPIFATTLLLTACGATKLKSFFADSPTVRKENLALSGRTREINQE